MPQTTLFKQVQQWLFQEQIEIDQHSHTFFVFKAFPDGIKPSERKAWSQLQIELLSPFETHHHYYFLSEHGVHIWFSKTPLNGVPETASQSLLDDGVHFVNGANQNYQQTWQDGTMRACVSLNKTAVNSTTSSDLIVAEAPWAKESLISAQAKSIKVWTVLVGVLFALYLCWLAVGLITTSVQSSLVESQNEKLNEQVGDKLSLQQSLSEAQSTLALVSTWQSETTNLPNNLAKVLGAFEYIEDTSIDLIQWNNNVLNLEFKSKQLNITQLVERIENISQVESVSINPSNREYYWSLEIEWSSQTQ